MRVGEGRGNELTKTRCTAGRPAAYLGLALGRHGLPLLVLACSLCVLRLLVDQEQLLDGNVNNAGPAAAARVGRANVLALKDGGGEKRKVSQGAKGRGQLRVVHLEVGHDVLVWEVLEL